MKQFKVSLKTYCWLKMTEISLKKESASILQLLHEREYLKIYEINLDAKLITLNVVITINVIFYHIFLLHA